MKDFRGPLPLTDDDFARIRANVMARMRPRRSVLAFRWAFAAMAAAVFVSVMSWKTSPVKMPTLPPRHAERSEAPLLPQPPALAEEPPHKTHPHRPKPRVEEEQPQTMQFRMEIQTSDPDIRIIWLPNQYDPKTEEHS